MSDWGMPPFDTFEGLLVWVKARRAEGRSKEELYRYLIAFMKAAREKGDDETDELIMDVLDGLSGHCAPHNRID